ncbi:MAG: sigma-54-dependent Fis family transcriptional regulator [Anaerolineales bacterium]|nr:sigma-54-dependent Fis family transcriptional regulator [Anaerolineales bacterium]
MRGNDDKGQPRVAVVDDEAIVCREIKRGLEKDRYLVETFLAGEPALNRLSQIPFDLVLCDLMLRDQSGLEVLKTIKDRFPQTEVIIITGYSSIDTAIEAIQAGAFHYVTKPVKMNEIRALAARAIEKVCLVNEKEALKKALDSQSRHPRIIGQSPLMQEVFHLIDKVASLLCNVLIHGESGTGKEMVAQAIHFQGPRRDRPFMSFNCGGFTEELIANELFGHEKGAFTGAAGTKIGLLEAAHMGTVFLDEISAMPTSMQVKLLRFIQERTLLRVGGVKPIQVDARIIAASNQDLAEAVTNKTFREDLFYRLNVVCITLPPLRDRKEDIPLLVRHFMDKYTQAFSKEVKGLAPNTMEVLLNYPFPGNVRELENLIERAVALTDESIISPHDLPPDLQRLAISGQNAWPSLEKKEHEYIRQVLIKTNYKKGLAAQILKIPRTTLWRKMKRLGLS